MSEPKRVLVVVDMQQWLDRTCAIVTSCGHEAIRAKNSREARWQLGNSTFDLLITDNWMEHENSGIELLSELCYDDADIPSILHTSEISLEQARRMEKDLPKVICILKLVRPENSNLVAAIQKLLS